MSEVDESRVVEGAGCRDCGWFITGDQMIEATAQKHANQEGHRVTVDYHLMVERHPDD